MICGIGTDIVEIARLDAAIVRFGNTFLKQFLTPQEMLLTPELPKRQREFYAGRWAAKEAIAKALGCGFGKKCAWLDIEILRLKNGAPYVSLSGKAAETASGLGICHWHLTISHEQQHAVAFAVAEK